MLAEFNKCNTRLPRDLRGLLPLLHIETEFQRKKVEAMRRGAESRSYELDVAMFAKFGEGLFRSKQFETPSTAAMITKRNGARAEGSFKDSRGRERPLHLIEHNGRWWVSGYTIEYETDTDKREIVEGITDMLLGFESHDDSHLQVIIDNVNSGKYKTVAEARKAYSDASAANIAERLRDSDR